MRYVSLLAVAISTVGVAQEPAPYIGPRISHGQIGCILAGRNPAISASMQFGEEIVNARLYFKYRDGPYFYVEMKVTPNGYGAVLPKPSGSARELTYYVQATSVSFAETRTPVGVARIVGSAGQCPSGARLAETGSGRGVLVLSVAEPGHPTTGESGFESPPSVTVRPVEGVHLEVIARLSTPSAEVVSRGPSVYWLDSGKVMRVPIAGGLTQPVLSVSGEGIRLVAVDEAAVYLLECARCGPVFASYRLRRYPWSKGAARTLGEFGDPAHVEADGEYVFLAFAHGDGVPEYALVRIRVRDGQRAELASEDDSVNAFTLDSKQVYWSATEEVRATPRSGGPTVVLASGQRYVSALTGDKTHVYWIDSKGPAGPDAVRRVAKAGGLTETLAVLGDASELAVGERSIYVTGSAANEDPERRFVLLTLPKAGGAPKPLAHFPLGPSGLHAGADGLCIVVDGIVYRVVQR